MRFHMLFEDQQKNKNQECSNLNINKFEPPFLTLRAVAVCVMTNGLLSSFNGALFLWQISLPLDGVFDQFIKHAISNISKKAIR